LKHLKASETNRYGAGRSPALCSHPPSKLFEKIDQDSFWFLTKRADRLPVKLLHYAGPTSEQFGA
jgi:hypothetical protein